jgi:hypothetical protein
MIVRTAARRRADHGAVNRTSIAPTGYAALHKNERIQNNS